jgi:hypothetical protein
VPPERERAPSAVGLILGVCLFGSAAADDFAVAVIEYQPAPGQFINNPNFNDPSVTLGPPTGGGTTAADLTDVLSLGGFGGSLTLAFSKTVLNDPRNPLGLDAIIFAPAFWPVGDPQLRFLEPAVLEISQDSNGNGLPDDTWFVISGSHLANPPQNSLVVQSWDDNPNTSTPPGNLSWYPDPTLYPSIGSVYSSSGYMLPLGLPDPTSVFEVVWGYADSSPTLLLGDRSGATGSSNDNQLTDPEDMPGMLPGCLYTVPDDPMTIGIDPYSGGGDAFDIDWAVNPSTGLPAGLDGFNFVRIRTGQNGINGPLGEISAEIDAVSDVRAIGDLNGDNRVDGADLGLLLGAWGTNQPCSDLDRDGVVNGADLGLLLGNWEPDQQSAKAELIHRLNLRFLEDIR